MSRVRQSLLLALVAGCGASLLLAAPGEGADDSLRSPYAVFVSADRASGDVSVSLNVSCPINFMYVENSYAEYDDLVSCARTRAARQSSPAFAAALNEVQRKVSQIELPEALRALAQDEPEAVEFWVARTAHELLKAPRELGDAAAPVSLYDYPALTETPSRTQAELDRILVEIGRQKTVVSSDVRELFSYCAICSDQVSLNIRSDFYAKFSELHGNSPFKNAYEEALISFERELLSGELVTGAAKTAALHRILEEKRVFDMLTN